MRLTIERLRTLVLITGGVMVLAIAAFLLLAKWRNHTTVKDLPARLGVNITQQADHVIYTQSRAGHTLFKIDARKVVQVANGVATLSDVKIDLYGAEGGHVDRIEGREFQYDQKQGIARAVGPVEITLLKPSQAPSIAPNATPHDAVTGKAHGKKPLAEAAATAESEAIHVRTSGLVYDQKSGVAETKEYLDFLLPQGTGSGDGALFDSQLGYMVIDRNVRMTLKRETGVIEVHAAHAEFERSVLVATLGDAMLAERATTAQAASATLIFREDGSVERVNAGGSLTISNAAGSALKAPRGEIEFDARNRPLRGLLDQGVVFDSLMGNAGAARNEERKMHGTAPTAHLAFNAQGDLSGAHLERNVEFSIHQSSVAGESSSRDWQSTIADLAFQKDARGRMVLKSIRGTGGARLNSRTGAEAHASMNADALTGNFNDEGRLVSLQGAGNAAVDQTNAAGIRQTATGDALDARFKAEPQSIHSAVKVARDAQGGSFGDLDHATLTGHVRLDKTQPGAKPPVHATASRAEYEGAGEWIHLTGAPRVVNGGVEITAMKIDFSRLSGDATAHGYVKATWSDEAGANANVAAGLGGRAPTHIVSQEAELRQATNDAVFTGQARLWQGNNSIAAPRITLNRNRQTLLAEGENQVTAIFLGAAAKSSTGNAPQLMRFHGSLLKYSAAERKAWLSASGRQAGVTAETGTGTIRADAIDVILLPVGVSESDNSAAVDRILARGHVRMNSDGRQASGDELVYSGESGEYTLTGPASHPPQISDPERGIVSGETLIFSTRDDSVKVEGTRTTAVTTTRK